MLAGCSRCVVKTTTYLIYCFVPRKMPSHMKTFKEKVQAIVRHIPRSKTMTYGEVAKKAGRPGAARAVGTIMSHNFDPKIPCHRVIRADGKIGNYNRGGADRKEEILREEGWSRMRS